MYMLDGRVTIKKTDGRCNSYRIKDETDAKYIDSKKRISFSLHTFSFVARYHETSFIGSAAASKASSDYK